MTKATKVTLGVLQFGDQSDLTPVVCLDCPDQPAAEHLAAFLHQVHNGERPMAGLGEEFATGDMAIKVEVHKHPERPREAVLADVWVDLAPGHWTHGFYAASTVERESAEVFRFMNQTLRQFVLTVSAGGKPCCELIYLVKYNLVWRSPIESAPV